MTYDRQRIVILDFGSQYTQLIARRIREARVYCEILPYNAPPETVFQPGVKGLVLSGGPASVTDADSPRCHETIFETDLPVLGICYGCQLMGQVFGANVDRSDHREYGPAKIKILHTEELFLKFPPDSTQEVWMSHGDYLTSLPDGFVTLAETASTPYAAIADRDRCKFGVQFHPEVTHTACGQELLNNFLFGICGCQPQWTPEMFVEETISDIRQQVGNGKVVCGLSGGVDSAVVTMLLDQAIGDNLLAVFVDNGILRKGEVDAVEVYFSTLLKHRFVRVDAGEEFLTALLGVSNPEEKRKIIGEKFIRVFEREAGQHGKIDYLAQGTLYPDVIESTPVMGPSATIKSHHNVGGLPERMDLELVEPLRFLFKDEVREVGLSLGLPEDIVWRQPFPGPGLAVRILGEVTQDRVQILQNADAIVRNEIAAAGLMRSLWQVFAVLLPVKTVGVMGDERTYEHVCAIRAVTSTDAMTADWARLPADLLAVMSNRIINEVNGINRVVYDISSKPPATIEWE